MVEKSAFFRLFKGLKVLGQAFRQFFIHGGIDKSSILAYYSIFSSFFLLIFFISLFPKFLGDPDLALKNMYPFSADFFAKIAPVFVEQKSNSPVEIKSLGVAGIAIFLFLGILIFKKMIQYVNEMFYIAIKGGFFFKRLKEFMLLSVVGILVLVSFFLTGFTSTITAFFYKNRFIPMGVSPAFVESLNHFMVKYLIPFLITFLFFFILYKWIPERVVSFRSAFWSALVGALLWEIGKRVYTYYLINISLVGKIKGPIISIILFGFWMEISMGIMLYGAKMAYILEKERT